MNQLNLKDLHILNHLQRNGKLSYAEVGSRVGLSVSAVKERIKRLKRDGILGQNIYRINSRSVGLDLCAFVQVLMPVPTQEANFIEQIDRVDEVQECHCITGEYSYLLKIRVENTPMLEKVLAEKIKSIKGVVRTKSIIALTTSKETVALRIGQLDSL